MASAAAKRKPDGTSRSQCHLSEADAVDATDAAAAALSPKKRKFLQLFQWCGASNNTSNNNNNNAGSNGNSNGNSNSKYQRPKIKPKLKGDSILTLRCYLAADVI